VHCLHKNNLPGRVGRCWRQVFSQELFPLRRVQQVAPASGLLCKLRSQVSVQALPQRIGKPGSINNRCMQKGALKHQLPHRPLAILLGRSTIYIDPSVSSTVYYCRIKGCETTNWYADSQLKIATAIACRCASISFNSDAVPPMCVSKFARELSLAMNSCTAASPCLARNSAR
jgi:hypothetical protein